ncbi:MAG: class I SAM-dependent methyltransferase [Alphaproteobacteria bacterium]|nr:class I SAM-dependent methyltransferase [Alphaproteobacteria bacterium]
MPLRLLDHPFRAEHFRRADEASDADFYSFPRLVTHIDDAAIAALTRFYGDFLAPGSDVLDLMSSWVSHLPPAVDYRSVVGLGMNAAELAANPRLSRWLVHDLNQAPGLPFADAHFDACLIAVSVQYLARPLEVFTEIARVLRPGGGLAVSFSNRMFATKAVAVWRALDAAGHAQLVALYCQLAGFAAPVLADLSPAPGRGDPLHVVATRKA